MIIQSFLREIKLEYFLDMGVMVHILMHLKI